jgi:hypothetical protein
MARLLLDVALQRGDEAATLRRGSHRERVSHGG